MDTYFLDDDHFAISGKMPYIFHHVKTHIKLVEEQTRRNILTLNFLILDYHNFSLPDKAYNKEEKQGH